LANSHSSISFTILSDHSLEGLYAVLGHWILRKWWGQHERRQLRVLGAEERVITSSRAAVDLVPDLGLLLFFPISLIRHGFSDPYLFHGSGKIAVLSECLRFLKWLSDFRAYGGSASAQQANTKQTGPKNPGVHGASPA
jgi:hypothetical protein